MLQSCFAVKLRLSIDMRVSRQRWIFQIWMNCSFNGFSFVQNNKLNSGFCPIMPRVSFAPPSLCLTHLPLLDLPPTVRDVDVPSLFRERFILSGYRPVGQSWRCYVLSLFQVHNETLNVWSHLLAAVCVVMRFMVFAVLQGGVLNCSSPGWSPGV